MISLELRPLEGTLEQRKLELSILDYCSLFSLLHSSIFESSQLYFMVSSMFSKRVKCVFVHWVEQKHRAQTVFGVVRVSSTIKIRLKNFWNHLPSPTEVSFLHFVRSEIVKSVRRGQLSRSMVSRDSVSSDFEMYSIPWSVKFSQWDRVNSETIMIAYNL